MLTEEQVRHIARLARLELTDKEVGRMSKELSGILDYVGVLNEVDTAEVQLTSQVTGLTNVSGDDEVKAPCSREEMLDCTKLPVELNQIRVKAVMKE